MFNLVAIQSFFGDCLLLEYGTPQQPRYMLVDGGPANTFEQHLSAVLKKLKSSGRDLELVILSHVDTDHVTGLLDYFAELRGNDAGAYPAVGGVWHNSFGQTIDPNGTLAPRLQAVMNATAAIMMPQAAMAINGIAEGNQLRTQAVLLGLPLNAGFPDNLIITDTAGAPKSFGNLTLTIAGPTQANLDELRAEWEEWLEKHEDDLAGAVPRVMANADRSVANLSSIQLLAEADGKTLLLTGDGRSDHLLQGLRQADLLDGNGALHVDVLKLPHHGSDRNVTRKFFRTVTADTYVASADGTHGNPDLATLIWIVEVAREAQREITVICTNETESTDKLQDDYPADDYGYTLKFMPSNKSEIRIPIA